MRIRWVLPCGGVPKPNPRRDTLLPSVCLLAEREGTVAQACKYVLSLIRGRDTRQPALTKKGPRALLLPPHTARFIIFQEWAVSYRGLGR